MIDAEKRHSVMVKFTKEEFDFLLRYQRSKLGNCYLLNPPALKLTNGDTVRLILQEFFKLTAKGKREIKKGL